MPLGTPIPTPAPHTWFPLRGSRPTPWLAALRGRGGWGKASPHPASHPPLPHILAGLGVTPLHCGKLPIPCGTKAGLDPSRGRCGAAAAPVL